MNQTVKNKSKDPMGAAIEEYYHTGESARLRVLSSMFDEDEIPVRTLFRSFEEMPHLEQTALQMAAGTILDVGAGAGCHSLALQAMNKDVRALEISELSVNVMRERGVEQVLQEDFFSEKLVGPYDTILMLMNGSGIIGEMSNMPRFFAQLDRLLSPKGFVLLDSTDLSYLYEDEEGFIDLTGVDNYYGEVDFQMRYKGLRSDTFNWLYIDFETLNEEAKKYGYVASLIELGEDGNAFLAKIEKA